MERREGSEELTVMVDERDGHRDPCVEGLADDELLKAEARLGREFLRLELLQPHRRDTTFRVLKGSAGLLHAWTRWRAARLVVARRGLDAGCVAASGPNETP